MRPRTEDGPAGNPVRSRQVRVSGEERRRQIIEAAATLFSRKGFRGTTTWEIAKAVGVSEAMLFKHFATKEELYAAIIEAKSHPRRLLNTAMEAVERQDDAEVLRTLARGMIERTLADSTLMRLTYFSALEGHALSDMMFRSRVQELDDFLSQYIAKRVAAGAFRPVEPLLAAWNFIGMVAYHVQLLELFGQRPPAHLTTERVVEEIVALFLSGLRHA